MGSFGAIGIMIAVLLTLVGFVIFAKPLKSLLKFFIRAVIGLFAVFIVNLILSPFGLFIGLNYLTAFIIGILGLPGFISLYILQVLL